MEQEIITRNKVIAEFVGVDWEGVVYEDPIFGMPLQPYHKIMPEELQ